MSIVCCAEVISSSSSSSSFCLVLVSDVSCDGKSEESKTEKSFEFSLLRNFVISDVSSDSEVLGSRMEEFIEVGDGDDLMMRREREVMDV